MNFSISTAKHTLSGQNISLSFNQYHVLQSIRAGKIMISQYDTPEMELALANIYLRTKKNGQISATPLMYFNGQIETCRNESGEVTWTTRTEQFCATVTVSVATDRNTVFFTANVENLGKDSLTYDLIYGQDIALADDGAVKSNEAYCSQYIDQQVFQLEHVGYTVCCRQNLPQSSGNPWVQIGSFQPVAHFSTDGIQFFGKSYKFTNEPEALLKPALDDKRYQFEMAYIALQTQDIQLTAGEHSSHVFYLDFQGHMPASNVSVALPVADIRQHYSFIGHSNGTAIDLSGLKENCLTQPAVIIGETLNEDEITRFFGEQRRFPETEGGELLSFFRENSCYVTLKAKEQHLERATGHMIASGNNQDFANAIMSSTHGIYGVFNSHVVLGNTSFNKLLGVERSFLNLFKSSGQRIWVKQGEAYHLLTMPSAYEAGANHSLWVYKFQNGFIQVRCFSAQSSPAIQMDIKAEGYDQPLELMITHQLLMANNEHESHVQVHHEGNLIHITGDNALIADTLPELSYTLRTDSCLNQVDLVQEDGNGPVRYLVLSGTIEGQASITITGSLWDQQQSAPESLDFDRETTAFQDAQNQLINQFNIDFEHDHHNADKLNDTMQWFTHNALVHYSTPHGLEQYSGAAWGTRDVSQGPFEFFMSLQRYDRVAALLETIYSHQHLETGTWPQWFMFDQYARIQQEEAHGDVVVWPMKALADYLVATGDLSILDKQLPYTAIEEGFGFTEQKVSLFAHVERQLKHIIDNLVPGTSLSCYGDGDWDDTLQPAKQALRENMVSGWTIPLTLQTLKTMSRALAGHGQYEAFINELNLLADKMEADYHRYLVKDGVIAGFIHFANGDTSQVEYLLHPADQKTGIKYRLLPGSRSIISETFNPELAEKHMAIINDHLLCPDGVRLMDRMAEYKAGKQSYFKRAELAANLGREVGLQYCHAHIRFIEALCKMGKAEAVFENLYKIIPVGIQSAVPNAELRQSNAYFSSSDGKFNDRYEAYDNFQKLRTGDVKVKGGWRIYSSGSGIYINQLISSVLGIRYQQQSLVLDPVIAKALGKVTLNFRIFDKPCQIVIHPEQGEHTPKKVCLNGEQLTFTQLANPYRTGAALVEKDVIENQLSATDNLLEIWL
ncbi:GH36-type glycosyl hydrolase domain-containing protein [Endozoicomonas atrinae]|uniref:GH36-type glycosyl hydrolase domain-containing protein n=1 Tax=Endozoicomonas atrinae TaxID=1333660 RepID=UPI000825497E|nr:cellobiose phosphorylase [Endozoicomonas atrinae]